MASALTERSVFALGTPKVGARGYGAIARPKSAVTAPVVSNVVPAAGTDLDPKTGVVGFDVSTSGTVGVYLPEIGAFEVVWYGAVAGSFQGGFGPQYVGSRTALNPGFRFSNVIRRGGWPQSKASPTLGPTFVQL